MPTSITIAPFLDPLAADHARAARPPRRRRRRGRRPPRGRACASGTSSPSRALEQQQRHRLADQQAAPDDDGVRAPRASAPVSSSRRMMPSGVHGRRPGRPASRRPWLIAVRPSTSLSGAIAWMTASVSSPSGSGSCTRMPCTSLARVQLARRARPGRPCACRRQALPERAHADLGAGPLLDADVDARGRIVADEHRRQARERRRARAEPRRARAASARTACATALPSRIVLMVSVSAACRSAGTEGARRHPADRDEHRAPTRARAPRRVYMRRRVCKAARSHIEFAPCASAFRARSSRRRIASR